MDPRRSNLSAEQTSFVGRAAALAEIAGKLERARAVTVVGTAGVGKTRTAKQVARDRHDLDALCFVDLSFAAGSGDAARAIAAALGRPPGRCAPGNTLILLDGCEHFGADAAELVTEILRASGRSRVLITARDPIGFDGESVHRLEPLRPGEAMALFESRARMIRYDFAVQQANREVIERLVDRLDRLPLAIELAAARIGSVSPEAMLERLPDAREAALHHAIEWSWRALSPWERSALVQCSVFRGGFDLAGAERIVDLSEHPAAPRLVEVIQALRARGLIRACSPAAFPNEVRFELYESVRAFAHDMLSTSRFADYLELQHARRYLAAAKLWVDQLDASSDVRRRAALEIGNLLAAQRRTAAVSPATAELIGLLVDRLMPAVACSALAKA